jgi:predicted DNA-binding transcriptional regulator AlpA
MTRQWDFRGGGAQGGSPDWEGVPMEVARYVLRHGIPDDPTPLVRHLLGWFSERGAAPGTETVRRHVLDLLAELHKPTEADREYLTDAQFRELIGSLDPRTTVRWRRDGEGPPFVRVGPRRVLYRRSEVDAWLRARTFDHRAAEAVASQAT